MRRGVITHGRRTHMRIDLAGDCVADRQCTHATRTVMPEYVGLNFLRVSDFEAAVVSFN